MTQQHPRHVPSPTLRVFLLGFAVSVILFCAGLLTMLGAHTS